MDEWALRFYLCSIPTPFYFDSEKVFTSSWPWRLNFRLLYMSTLEKAQMLVLTMTLRLHCGCSFIECRRPSLPHFMRFAEIFSVRLAFLRLPAYGTFSSEIFVIESSGYKRYWQLMLFLSILIVDCTIIFPLLGVNMNTYSDYCPVSYEND